MSPTRDKPQGTIVKPYEWNDFLNSLETILFFQVMILNALRIQSDEYVCVHSV